MLKYSKLSKYKVEKIIECFCIDIDATKTSLVLGFNRKTILRYFAIFRKLIYTHQYAEKNKFVDTIEVDESFFGSARTRGRVSPRKRGRGTNKQPVFGIYERNGRVYTEIIKNCSAYTLQAIIRGKVSPDCRIHSDC